MTSENIKYCPCGTGNPYITCCGKFITQQQLPATPEELMRSRYTAYTKANVDYLALTMKSPAADHFDKDEARSWAEKISWTKLQIIRSTQDGNRGIVEFIAFYSSDNKETALHEISEFTCENGQWYYTKGSHPKPGRNDKCSCGSNKKYKKCCMDQA